MAATVRENALAAAVASLLKSKSVMPVDVTVMPPTVFSVPAESPMLVTLVAVAVGLPINPA